VLSTIMFNVQCDANPQAIRPTGLHSHIIPQHLRRVFIPRWPLRNLLEDLAERPTSF